MEKKPVIRISNLTVVYGGKRRGSVEAVSGLDLEVQQGEVVGFVGPNGAGKTSTIKVLMGFLFPTQGTAEVLGAAAGSIEARRRIGFLPEVAVYYPFLTAWETLVCYATLQEIPKAEQKALVSELIAKVGLSGREREPLRNFSKGMLQRVGLAQAIMGDPDLLILDEVNSGLDPVARRDVREILLEFKARGKTVFFSSHELSEVTLLCDRVILLDQGKVLEERPLEEMLNTMRRYVTVVKGSVEGLALEPGTAIRSADSENTVLVAHTEPEHARLQQQLQAAGREIAEIIQEPGSLEDYFVETIGHKVT